ncbi:hypothetical protein MXD81_00040 [Microbacteriaceae bacterium K1510]|nr:hypothetical protein [Microbacteriaceae bacterium K1510]
MRNLALIVLAAASLMGTANVASAQYWSGGYYYDGPPRHHHHRYYRDYDYDRGYRGDRYYREQPRYRTRNGCPPGYTVQDGVCKPYTGR